METNDRNTWRIAQPMEHQRELLRIGAKMITQIDQAFPSADVEVEM